MSLTTFSGVLRNNEPMARHVTWRAGGVAARAYWPLGLADLARFLAALPPTEPLLMVGLGSNLLVRDGGFAGTVVFTHRALGELRQEADGGIYCEAGVASPKLARFAANADLSGAEFLAGIPGTLGGALAMNAGCHGDETWNHVDRVLMLNRRGELVERRREAFEIGYRHVAAKFAQDEMFAAAWLRFAPGDAATARARMAALLSKRAATQPLQLPNAGSVFRNPPGDFAARLIEATGLKGLTVNGAQVSEKHANFIVNPQRSANAQAIETLILRVQAEVLARFGILLQPEVRIVGSATARPERLNRSAQYSAAVDWNKGNEVTVGE